MTQQVGTGQAQQATTEGPRRRRSISLLDGIRPYQRGWLRTDIVAGITLAALAIPEVVVAVLIVFERWIKAVPGGLVAVVGAIVASWALDLQSHGVPIPPPRMW